MKKFEIFFVKFKSHLSESMCLASRVQYWRSI